MKCKLQVIITAFFITLAAGTTAFCQTVIPSGEAVGVSLKTEGLLVTGITQVTDENGLTVNAAYKAGVQKGDRIIAVDGNTLSSIEDFTGYVKDRPNQIVLTVMRGDKKMNHLITPVKTETGYKIGVWVRDSTAGIGTITYINPDNSSFAGLGHGISDVDTGDILTIKKGNILTCSISAPTKGRRGDPGELNGIFSNAPLGEITKNSECGIFGKYTGNCITDSPVEIADPYEIKAAPATILANVDGNGKKEYEIRIRKISHSGTSGKNMIIEVTDPSLLEKTGGIVQGMSGAPILQNGKLAGAVTHVFVNDPKRGYAIFAAGMAEYTK